MSRSRSLATILVAVVLTACGDKSADQSQPSAASRTERRKLESPRDSAIVDIIARGDSAIVRGDTSEALATWKMVLGFDSTDAEARQKHDAIPGRGIAATSEEAKYAEGIGNVTNNQRWCEFPAASPKGDLTNLRMLSDRQLIPTLRTAGLRAPAGRCGRMDLFLFLGRPQATIAEVRQRYGTPDAETIDDQGRAVIDYGRFRLFGTAADGKIVAVMLPPFKP